MNLFEIEIGRKYKCDRNGGQYFATVAARPPRSRSRHSTQSASLTVSSDIGTPSARHLP
jgi:hypothetical protein